jgi:ADP-ribose pyrophosphatase
MFDDSLARVPWRQRSTREVYRNKWIRVREDIAELPDGRTTIYGVIECPPCVGVLPFLDADTVVLVGQFRYISQTFDWEITTGAMAPGETEEDAVQRELTEEAGYRAERVTKLCTFHTSKSVMREVAHIYMAEGLSPVPRTPDETEFIEVRAVPFAEALRMALASEIVDAMSVVAILHAARRRERA